MGRAAEPMQRWLPILDFVVPGTPRPQGSVQPRMSKSGKMFVTYKQTTVKHRQKLVDVAVPLWGGKEPDSGPIAVRVHFNMRRPLSHFGTGRNANVLKPDARKHPTSVPDTDKLLRLVLDGITAAGIIADDSQVIYVKAIKRYADGEPSTYIEIWRILDEPLR